ncbi:MAG: germination protein YpeB [Clostridium sp.]
MFKKQNVVALLVIILVIGSVSFGIVTYSENKVYKNYLKAQYQMNLYNLLEDVKDMQVSLSKVTVSSSKAQRAVLFDQISREANSAKDMLHSLPIAHEAIGNTSKFLSQVSDYTYMLVKYPEKSNVISADTNKVIEGLKNYSAYLTLQLKALESEILSGSFDWETIRNQVQTVSDPKIKNAVDTKFNNISGQMQEYPTMIYDGPYSDNALNIKPKILNEKVVSKDTALENARGILGNDRVSSIKVSGETKNNALPAYSVIASLKGQDDSTVNMDISKNGGKLVYMLNNRTLGEEKINMKQAISFGTKFIKDNPYPKMVPLYAMKYDNAAVINYVYVKDGVIVYSDQVKIKVALDNGEIIGVEAHTFLKDHSSDRNIEKPTLDYKALASEISKKAKLNSVRLALIPIDGSREVLCYEYVVEKSSEKYIVYINATTGKEENILKIIETPNGELTM